MQDPDKCHLRGAAKPRTEMIVKWHALMKCKICFARERAFPSETAAEAIQQAQEGTWLHECDASHRGIFKLVGAELVPVEREDTA